MKAGVYQNRTIAVPSNAAAFHTMQARWLHVAA